MKITGTPVGETIEWWLKNLQTSVHQPLQNIDLDLEQMMLFCKIAAFKS